MRFLGRREWAILGGAVVLLGGLGFIQSRGGWLEVVNMAPKRDDSTPAIQSGFELLGVERTTEGEPSPRLAVGDASLGGSTPGPIGSTRLWFRLPPATPGEPRVPKDADFQTFVRFPSGDDYPVRWEIADLTQRILTILVPAGYAPCEWMEVRVDGAMGSARWRLTGIPKTPRALPTEGKTEFESDGAKIVATARHLPRKMLNSDSLGGEMGTLAVTVSLDGHLPSQGRGVRAVIERYTPEFQHPADVKDADHEGMLVPGETPINESRLSFPYGDRMRFVGVKGRLETLESVREPIEFPDVRWAESITIGDSRNLRLESKPVQLTDGLSARLSGESYAIDFPKIRGQVVSKAIGPTGSPLPLPNYAIVELTSEPAYAGWEDKVKALAKSQGRDRQFFLGNLHGFFTTRKVIRTVPFELLVPLGPVEQKDIDYEKTRSVVIPRDTQGAWKGSIIKDPKSTGTRTTSKAK